MGTWWPKITKRSIFPTHCGDAPTEGLGWQRWQTQRPDCFCCLKLLWSLVFPEGILDQLNFHLLHNQTRPVLVRRLMNYKLQVVKLSGHLDRLSNICLQSHVFLCRHWWRWSDNRGTQCGCSGWDPSMPPEGSESALYMGKVSWGPLVGAHAFSWVSLWLLPAAGRA